MKLNRRIVFAKGKFYIKNITVPMIHEYYNSVLPRMESELEDNKLYLLNGVEAVKTLKDNEPFVMVHVSPLRGVGDSVFKPIVKEFISTVQGMPDIDSLQVYFDGNRGYKICPYFGGPKRMSDSNSALTELLNPLFTKYVDKVRSTVNVPNQRVTLPYSINKDTGLAQIPVKDLDTFNAEDAKITNYTKASYVMLPESESEVPAIGIDFDNTLFLPYGEDYYSGELNESVAELAIYAKKAGYKVIILTARVVNHPEDIDFIAKFLEAHGVPFDEITPIKKPEIEIIIDDKAVAP